LQQPVIQTTQAGVEVPTCQTEGCGKPSPFGPFCPTCYGSHQQEQRMEKIQELAKQGKTLCNGESPDGQSCRWIVTKRPDGRPALCPKCDSIRLIVGANRAIDSLEDETPEELQVKLDEAEDHFNLGNWSKALGAARRFFVLLTKHQVEVQLAQVEESKLGEKARQAYDEALEAYEAERYYDARNALSNMREIGLIEAEITETNPASLNSFAREALIEAKKAFEAGNLQGVRDALQTMRSRSQWANELDQAKLQDHSRPKGGRQPRRNRRQNFDRNWRSRLYEE